MASPGKRKPYKPNTKTMVLTYLLQKACQKIEYYALKMNYLKQNIHGLNLKFSKISKIGPKVEFKDSFISLRKFSERAKSLDLSRTFHELSNGITHFTIKTFLYADISQRSGGLSLNRSLEYQRIT